MDAHSVDEVSDNFWLSPATEPVNMPDMSRSSSESSLQRFLEDIWNTEQGVEEEDDVVEIEKPQYHHHPPPPPPLSDQLPIAPIVFDYHPDLLKQRLDLACTAVAQLGSQVIGPWNGFPMPQVKADGEPLGVPPIHDLQKISGTQIMQATSGSSRYQSDDDELDGETETTENMEPTDERRVRRKQSNRESAKRSRRRKQENLNGLETQAARLRIEKSSLLKLLNEWDQKYNDASVDNRVLKADIETLRAKVMMVEDKVKRMKGLNPLPLQPLSDIPNVGVSFGSNRAAYAGPLQSDLNYNLITSIYNSTLQGTEDWLPQQSHISLQHL